MNAASYNIRYETRYVKLLSYPSVSCRDFLNFYLMIFLVIFSGISFGDDENTSIKGYFKSWAIWNGNLPTQGLPPIPDSTPSESQNAFRLMLDYFPGKKSTSDGTDLSFQFHYEVQPFFQLDTSAFTTNTLLDSFSQAQDRHRYEVQPFFQSDTSAFTTNTLLDSFSQAQDRYRISSPDPVLIGNGQKPSVFQNLDRANIQINLENSDLTLGRQAVALGAARSINPTDIFIPFSVTTLNQEYRQGIDAIRFQHALGTFSELDTGFVFGHHLRDNAAWAQLLFPMGSTDLSIIITRANEDWLLGGGLQGAIGESGIWLEIAQLRGRTDTYNRYTAGLDRALSGDFFIQIEYHYSGAGVTKPENYLSLPATTPWQEHGIFLLGKQYLISAINWQISPLLSQGAQALYNLNDQSWLFSTTFELSISENFFADAGVYFFHGNPLEHNASLIIVPHSEFGSRPDSAYVSLRYYF